MFPPPKTTNIQEWVTKLWESLQRATDSFTDEAVLEDVEDRSFIVLRLQHELPVGMIVPIRRYIKNYAAESDMEIESYVSKKFYISFFVRPEPGAASQRKQT